MQSYFENKMHSTPFVWIFNILLALIIIVSAQLGRLVGIPDQVLPISNVWPATGFALAALLLFGPTAWPGIFIGNFIYNLLSFGDSSPTEFLAAFTISFGSLLQALLGNYWMRRFTSPGYFNNVRDIFVFLIPVGLLASLVASVIGITTLYIYGALLPGNFLNTFLTFWIGDSMGVYIFTPLLVVWLSIKPYINLQDYSGEALWMALSFIFLCFLTLYLNFPAAHLFIPLSIWVTYRFHMHGATLSIFLIALATLASTVFGYGSFTAIIKENTLPLLVTFLEIIVFTSLIIAGIIQERTRAWLLLQNHNIDLQEEVKDYRNELKEMHNEFFFQEKRASLCILLTAMHSHIQQALANITQLTKTSLYNCEKLHKNFDENFLKEHHAHLQELEYSLQRLVKSEETAYLKAKSIQEQTEAKSEIELIQSTNLHTLLNICLNKVTSEISSLYPDFTYLINKDFDKGLTPIPAFTEDLAYAFVYFFNHALGTMYEKKKRLGVAYAPTLDLQTINHPLSIEIVIKNNGYSLSEEQILGIFRSFLSEDPATANEAFALAFAHDTIVRLHKGDVKVNARPGEYLELILTLPKTDIRSNKRKN